MPSPEDSRVPLAPGATLNNGSLTITGAPLGIGGFGITYAATNLLGQKRAVKELFPIGTLRQGGKLLPDPSATQTSWTQEKLDAARAGFLDEGKRLAELEHQGIVKVFGAFRDNDTIYLEMEFLEGETLWLFARRQNLSRAASLSIVKEAGEALTYLHNLPNKGMVHRDVTPNNIMVCKDGRIVLIDLGAARQFIPNRTAHYTAIGTEGFAAPEQGLSQTRIGPYTDVYGLAAVTFWLLDDDNTPPPSCDHRLKVLHAGDPDPLPNHDPALTKALALKATERTQTVEEFLDAILGKAKTSQFSNATIERKEIHNHKKSTKKPISIVELSLREIINALLPGFFYMIFICFIYLVIDRNTLKRFDNFFYAVPNVVMTVYFSQKNDIRDWALWSVLD